MAAVVPTNIWEVGQAIVKRAEKAGSPAIVLTVDLQEGSNRETLFRAQMQLRECSACHSSSYSGYARERPRAGSGGFAQNAARKPMFDGLDLSQVTASHPDNLNWEYVKRLRDTVTVKLLLKGIVRAKTRRLPSSTAWMASSFQIMEDELRRAAPDDRKLARSDRRSCR